MRSVKKWAMLVSMIAAMHAFVVCDVPDHGSIFGIDYEFVTDGHHHGSFDWRDIFDDDCWFGDCDDDWSFDFDFDFD